MNKSTMYKSLITSVIVQIVTGVLEFASLFIHVPARFLLIRQMMMLEVAVQVVEGSFYAYWLYNFKNISNITPTRYSDWFITTPTMLINLIFYLIFLENPNDNSLDFIELFNKEFYTIITILILNWLMLLFGYLGEVSIIPVLAGVTLGFIPFFIYYYIIYKKYALLSDTGFKIFLYFFIFWLLYGVAAIMPYKLKNTCYNILDLFSKNFFGIFLGYLLYTNKVN